MGAGACCAKCIIITVNILVGFIGFLLLAIGLFMMFGKSLYQEQLDSVIDSIPGLMSQLSIGDVNDKGDLPIDLEKFLTDMAIPFVVIGSIFFVLAIMACAGSCCKSKCMMSLYVICLSILVAAQIICVAMFFSGSFKSQIQGSFQDMIDEKYKGTDCFEPECLTINFIQMYFECCGINSWRDFDTAKNWEKTRTKTVGGATVSVELVTPVSCCMFTGDFPSVTPASETCCWAPTPLTNNMDKGCWSAVSTFLEEYKPMIIGGLSAIIVFQVILVILSIFIVCKMDKDDEDDD